MADKSSKCHNSLHIKASRLQILLNQEHFVHNRINVNNNLQQSFGTSEDSATFNKCCKLKIITSKVTGSLFSTTDQKYSLFIFCIYIYQRSTIQLTKILSYVTKILPSYCITLQLKFPSLSFPIPQLWFIYKVPIFFINHSNNFTKKEKKKINTLHKWKIIFTISVDPPWSQ